MSRVCPDESCEANEVRPVAIKYRPETEEQTEQWFLVCPKCRYVFEKVDEPWWQDRPGDNR